MHLRFHTSPAIFFFLFLCTCGREMRRKLRLQDHGVPREPTLPLGSWSGLPEGCWVVPST